MPTIIKNIFSNIPIIKIDNVSGYVAQKIQKHESIQTPPNIAPPFPRFFMESKSFWNGDGAATFGLLFDAQSPQDVPNMYNGNTEEEELFATICTGKWVYAITLFAETGGGLIDYYFRWFVGVDDTGNMILGENGAPRWLSLCFKDNVENRLAAITQYLFPGLLAISFMHCKNVTATEHNPKDIRHKKPIRDSRGHLKKKTPQTKYYTLDIEPMKKVLKSEGNIDEVGLQRALHICRGHFKDYSNGKGLFGKYKGLYWWDSTVRGTEEAGKIEKDYAIKI